MMRSFLAFVLMCFVVVAPRVASAQEAHAQAESNVVEVGTPFSIQLSASTPNGTPDSPSLALPKGAALRGQSATPGQMLLNINGARSVRMSLQVVWSVVVDSVGTFTFTPSIRLGGSPFPVNKVTVKAVPRGQAPQRRPQDPFAQLFGSPFGSPFDDDDFFQGMPGFQFDLRRPAVPLDSTLALPAPRGSRAFLHALVDRRTAIVGEQVTLTIYLYVRADAGSCDIEPMHEASTPDFIVRQLRDDNGSLKLVGQANVGGEIWNVLLSRKIALFPLKTGDLKVGPMSLGVRFGRSGTETLESENFTIRSIEPTATDRPSNYVLGDVGDWTLRGEVTPREVKRGESVSVMIDLEGTGNLPTTLVPPAQVGLEWLPPTITEHLTHTGDRSGGKRTFNYIVRFKKTGEIDLGTIDLPYFSAKRRKYEHASLTFGKVTVLPNGGEEKTAPAADDPYRAVPEAKPRLARLAPEVVLVDRPWFYYCVFGPSFIVLAGLGLARGRVALSARREALKSSPAAKLRTVLDEGERLLSRSTNALEIERQAQLVVEMAVLRFTGIVLRGIAHDDAAKLLLGKNVSAAHVARIRAIGDGANEARFAPESANIDEARKRLRDAIGLAKELREGT